jgi:hypothetical protein
MRVFPPSLLSIGIYLGLFVGCGGEVPTEPIPVSEAPAPLPQIQSPPPAPAPAPVSADAPPPTTHPDEFPILEPPTVAQVARCDQFCGEAMRCMAKCAHPGDDIAAPGACMDAQCPNATLCTGDCGNYFFWYGSTDMTAWVATHGWPGR